VEGEGIGHPRCINIVFAILREIRHRNFSVKSNQSMQSPNVNRYFIHDLTVADLLVTVAIALERW
jgi:hypothetical protein